MCRFRYKVSRISHSKEIPGTVEEEKSYDLKTGKEDNKIRENLVKMLSETKDSDSITGIIPHLLPKFLKVKNNGDLKPIHQLMRSAESEYN